MKPQAIGFYFVGNASCALGAASDAVGIGPYVTSEDFVGAFGKYWFEVDHTLPCPECDKAFDRQKSRARTITHLNDDHGWTRERIADFVELHEPIDSVPVAEPLGEVDGISYVGLVK